MKDKKNEDDRSLQGWTRIILGEKSMSLNERVLKELREKVRCEIGQKAFDGWVETDTDLEEHVQLVKEQDVLDFLDAFLVEVFAETKKSSVDTLKQLLQSPELLEELAALEHNQWSLLIGYVKSVSIEEKDIVEQLWKEWRTLANMPYEKLPEDKKKSDRMFARDVVKTLLAVLEDSADV
jgi:phage pi2 protein 07